jgi:hypothetical protein
MFCPGAIGSPRASEPVTCHKDILRRVWEGCPNLGCGPRGSQPVELLRWPGRPIRWSAHLLRWSGRPIRWSAHLLRWSGRPIRWSARLLRAFAPVVRMTQPVERMPTPVVRMTHRCGAHVYSVYSGGLEDPSGGAHTCSGGPDAPTGGAHVCPGGPAMTHNRWSTSFCSGGLEGLSGGAHVLPRWSGCVPRVYQRLGDAHLRAVGKHIWVWPREGSSRRGRAPL